MMMSLLRKVTGAGVVAVFGVGLTVSAQADAPLEIAGATTVDAAMIIDLVETTPTLVILDNRNETDYNAGHIEGAVRLIDTDITEASVLAAHISALDTPALFYCNGLQCGRAANAVAKAVEWGYTNVYYYAKGMEEWKAEGLPLETR